MSYDPTTRPASGQLRTELRNQLLLRGWYPVPSGFPRDALLRVPVKKAPTFDNTDRSDTDWTEMWCICLWAKLKSIGQGTMKQYAIELQRYKKSARLRRAVLIAARIAADPNVNEKLAIDRGLKLLDPLCTEELQLPASPGKK